MDPDLDNGTGSMDPDLDNGTGSMDPDLGNAIDQEDAPPLDTTAIGDVLENLNKPITASGGKFPNAQVVEPAAPKTPVPKATTPMSKAIPQPQVSKVSRKSSRNKSKFNTSTMSKSFCMKGMERKLSARARGVKESARIPGKDDRGAAYRSIPTKGRALDTDRS
jgi:hypothetical protein